MKYHVVVDVFALAGKGLPTGKCPLVGPARSLGGTLVVIHLHDNCGVGRKGAKIYDIPKSAGGDDSDDGDDNDGA